MRYVRVNGSTRFVVSIFIHGTSSSRTNLEEDTQTENKISFLKALHGGRQIIKFLL